VWTGADARDRGLVDTLGGLEHAVTRAAERAGTVRERVRVVRVPHPSPLERLRPATSSESAGAAAGDVGVLAGFTVDGLAGDALRGLGLSEAALLSLPGPWRLR
jgi:protease IV